MFRKKHLATITILVKDRQSHAQEVNKVLSEFGHHIIARLGVNVQRSCVKNCTAMISVAVEGTVPEIKKLVISLDNLYGIVCKYNIMTE